MCEHPSLQKRLKIPALLLASAAFHLCSAEPFAAVPEASSPAAPVLSACETDYPPFSMLDPDGRPDGFSVELMRAVCRAMGREVEFQTGTWNEVRGLLDRGDIRALPLVGRTPEREDLYDFTVPYLVMHGAVVVRRDNAEIRSFADLCGRSVAVMEGDNAEEFLRREGQDIRIHTTPSFVEALRLVAAGQADAVLIQRLVGLRLLQETGLSESLRLLDQPVPGFRQDFCLAVREGDREMLALLNEGLALVMADGTYRRLHAKWFASLELPSHRRIVIGGDHDFPPFEFLDAKGRPSGLAVDLTRAIARETGMQIEIRLGPWVETLEGLRRGEIDALQGLYYTPGRSERYEFTPAYLHTEYVAVARKGARAPASTWNELEGLRVAVQLGDVIHEVLREYDPRAQITTFSSQEEALRAVVDGSQDCALVGRLAALHLIARNAWTRLEVAGPPFFAGEYCYAVNAGNKALLAQLGDGLQLVSSSGELRRIQNKWLGVYERDHVPLGKVLGYALLALGPLVLVLVVAVAGSWLLQRKVDQRTADLAASEARYRGLFQDNLCVMLVIDPEDGDIVDANPAAAGFYGWSVDDLSDMNIARINPSDTPQTLANLRDLRDGKTQAFFNFRHRLADGSLRDVEVFSGPIHYQARTLIHSIVHDVTDRRRAEAHVEHLNHILRAIRGINQLIVREQDARILVQKACGLLTAGGSYDGALILLFDARKGAVADFFQAGMDALQKYLPPLLAKGEVPACCKMPESAAGTLHFIDTATICAECPVPEECRAKNAVVTRLEHGGTYFGHLIVRRETLSEMDADEQELLREIAGDVAYALHTIAAHAAKDAAQLQLQQAQKMDSIGRLAGGVAHDFNNLLMGIMGYAELCQEELCEGHPGREHLDQILLCAKRSADLTRQLLAFARKQTIAPQTLDLNETVSSMLKLLQRLIGEDVLLSWAPGSALGKVRVDPTQIDQILANLCVNARDAIRGVGNITIETRTSIIEADYCREHADVVAGRYVELAVSDNGCGIEPETLQNIFDPFFTTKGVGEGTGLGLSTVHGIARQNGGFVNVYSEPGSGSTFRVYLPECTDADTSDQPDADANPSKMELTGSETILLVEDEPSVLAAARRFLADAGYQVLAADSPAEALAAAENHPGVIDLLISDVVMPEISGRDLGYRLVESRPGLKCLYMSGYTADVIAHRGILDEGVAFLPKPFGRTELLRKARQVLDA